MCSKTLGWSLVIFPVGPKKTDQMSTHGMIAATSTAQATFSKNDRNQKPSTNEREQLGEVEEHVEVGEPRSDQRPRPAHAATASSRGLNASGSSSRTSGSVAGMRTSAMKRTSGQSPALQR